MKNIIKLLVIIIVITLIESCSIASRRNYKDIYEVDGYLIWTNFSLDPAPNKKDKYYNLRSIMYVVDKKYIDCKWDGSKYSFKSKKEIIPIIILQGICMETSPNFVFMVQIPNKDIRSLFLKNFYKDSNHETSMLKGRFLVKKDCFWQKMGDISRLKYFLFYNKYKKYLYKDVYKITFNGQDTIKIKPLWDFKYLESRETKEYLENDKDS